MSAGGGGDKCVGGVAENGEKATRVARDFGRDGQNREYLLRLDRAQDFVEIELAGTGGLLR